MLEKLEYTFFNFFDIIDKVWKYLTIDFIKNFEFKYKDNIINHIKYVETRLQQYNPISVFIGAVLIFYLIFTFLRILRKIWRKISKTYLIIIFFLFSNKPFRFETENY
jgi:hypothetical protein